MKKWKYSNFKIIVTKEKSNILLVVSFLLMLCCNNLDNKDKSTIKFRTLSYSDTGINFKNKLAYKTKVNIIEYLYYYLNEYHDEYLDEYLDDLHD